MLAKRYEYAMTCGGTHPSRLFAVPATQTAREMAAARDEAEVYPNIDQGDYEPIPAVPLRSAVDAYKLEADADAWDRLVTAAA